MSAPSFGALRQALAAGFRLEKWAGPGSMLELWAWECGAKQREAVDPVDPVVRWSPAVVALPKSFGQKRAG